MPNWKKVIVSGSDAILNQITSSGGIDTTNLDVSGIATYNTIEYSNSNTMKFNQRYTGGAIGTYFSNGEYQKVITITPDGSSQNYQVIGRITAQNAGETHTVYFNAALRSNTLPDLDWSIYYDEEYNGARYIDPQLWTKETSTAGFIFAFKTLATIYGSVTVDIDVVPRAASQKANVSINSVQDSEQTSIDSGFTANDMVKVVSKNQTDVNFSAEISSSDITIDDWGSVSASLSTLTSDVANIDSNVTLQDATDNGSTTTNNITIDSTGDARLVLDRAANSNDSEIEFKTNGTTNWTIGTGQVGSDNEFTIKGGSTNYVRINESGQADFLSAVTSSDITIDDWGSVSASLASLDASVYGDSDVTSHINSLNVHSGSHLGTANTDDLPEGSTNLYYTDGRVKTKLNTEGVISGSTYSSPSQGTLRATINGVNTDVDTGLQVADSPTFDSLTLTGDLTVLGTKTELQVTQLNVEDLNIKVASGSAGSAAANGAGLYVDGADVGLFWNHANQRFQFDADLHTNTSLSIGQVVNAGTDTDKFLVLDSNGTVDFRTGTEVASDIGALTTDPTLQEVTDAGATTTNEISTPSLSVGASGTSISSSLGGATLLIGDLTNSDSTVDIRTFGAGTNAGGRLVIGDDSLDFKSAGTSYFQVDSSNVTLDSTLKLNQTVNAGTDTDKFLVLDSNGNVDFRTGTEVYDDIGVTALSSSIAADIEGRFSGILTPIQLTVDTKALTAGFVPWSVLTDLQPSPDRAYTTWIAPTDGFLHQVIVSPEQTNSTTDSIRISLVNGGSTVSTTQSVTMGAAGTNKTFTFGAPNYLFSSGDRLSIEFDKLTNTSDLYNVMVVFRMSNV